MSTKQGSFDSIASSSTDFGNPDLTDLAKAGEVRIPQVRADLSLEFRHLFPSDAPETAIPEDEVHRRRALPLRRLQFMHAHQKTAVSAQGHDPAIRIQ